MRAQGIELEQGAQQVPGRLADQDGVGRGKRLKPRGEVGCLADDGALLCGADADDLADHDQAGGDADARLQRHAVGACYAGHFGDDGKSGMHRARGRILVGMWKAEIGEYAIAHELGDEAAEPSDGACRGILIPPDQAAQDLRIERT